ncbi:hypothetical protein ACFUIW_26875 [Streptomyces sp. NPDC057245]|uniref:hypothetical protein n=1 Tax=Streptomyces TaxID=1883 RepID=UPI001C1E5C1D|nr:hypothetical protein [Streptomyces sp. A108]MBU6536512.1 hypothetical protein [Streptomyces sp. A108]
MPHDPYAVLRALLRAEAARRSPRPEPRPRAGTGTEAETVAVAEAGTENGRAPREGSRG